MLLFYTFLGIFQGIFLCIFIFLFIPQIVCLNGQTIDLELLGTMIYIVIILTVLMQICLDTYCYNLIYYISHALSLLFLMIFIVVQNYGGFTDVSLLGIGDEIISSPFTFFSIFCTSVVCIIPYYVIYSYKILFYPNIINKLNANACRLLEYNKLDPYKESLMSIYAQSSEWKNHSKDEKFSLNKYNLHYNLPYIEKDYKRCYITENLLIIK